ncbi:MAG: alpha/beta hydrolase [Candidatus Sulfotelmatobacter sp.]
MSAILLSPWPESLYTFEQMWPRLAEHAHLVAVDLPGFGHSERRDELFTSSAMGSLSRIWWTHLGSSSPTRSARTLVPPHCCSRRRDILAFIRSIVIGNGTAAVPIQVDGVLKDVIDMPSLEPLRNRDPRKGVESVLAFVERYKLPDHVREDFLSSYEGDRFVESIRFLRAYKTELPKLSKLLPTIETPVQIITGDHDPGVLPVNGDYLHERIHHNTFDKVNAGHFAWADVADEYANLIIDWWEGGYERSLRSK